MERQALTRLLSFTVLFALVPIGNLGAQNGAGNSLASSYCMTNGTCFDGSKSAGMSSMRLIPELLRS